MYIIIKNSNLLLLAAELTILECCHSKQLLQAHLYILPVDFINLILVQKKRFLKKRFYKVRQWLLLL